MPSKSIGSIHNQLRLTALTLCLFLTATSGADSQPAQPNQKAATDHQRIQGEWMVVRTDHGGRRPVVEEGTGVKHLWSIAAGKVSIRYGDGTKKEIAFRLDPDAKPKAIDVTERDETYLGIYALGDDTLEIHYSRNTAKDRERPKAFIDTSAFEDRTRRYFRLVRVKPVPVKGK